MRLVTNIPVGPEGHENLTAEALRAYLEGIIAVNRLIILNQPIPWLYKSGIRFEAENETQGYDFVPNFLDMLALGYGDCAPLVAARVAELRERCGENATVKVYWRPRGNILPFHAQVRRKNGTIEDPARRLGMADTPGRKFE